MSETSATRPRPTSRRLVEVARAYYLDDLSKIEIGDRFGLSRWQVARLLDEAKRRGYVQIHVGEPEHEDDLLSRRLAVALGIDEAVVVGRSTETGIAPTQDSVAAALAAFLAREVRPSTRLGLSWSRVIEFLPRRLQRLAPCDVVQLAGALSYSGDRLGSVEVIRQVAHTSGGTAYPMYAPLFADDPATAAAFRRQPSIAACLRLAEEVDLAVVSIGAWTAEGSALYPLLPDGEAAAIAAGGGIGDVSAHVFDAHGGGVAPGLDARIIGIGAEGLRAVSRTVATSYGRHRVDATIGAVRAGFVDVLIVDEPLASAILERLDRAEGRT